VYLHSDMVEDLVKVVGNVRPHIINLKGLMSIYPKFDKLINVSDNIHQINKKKLKKLKIDEKFITVKNLLDLNEIYKDVKKQENKNKIKKIKINKKINTLKNLYDLNKINKEVEKEKKNKNYNAKKKQINIGNSPSSIEIINFNKNHFKIFASGRLSPEKGFDN